MTFTWIQFLKCYTNYKYLFKYTIIVVLQFIFMHNSCLITLSMSILDCLFFLTMFRLLKYNELLETDGKYLKCKMFK